MYTIFRNVCKQISFWYCWKIYWTHLQWQGSLLVLFWNFFRKMIWNSWPSCMEYIYCYWILLYYLYSIIVWYVAPRTTLWGGHGPRIEPGPGGPEAPHLQNILEIYVEEMECFSKWPGIAGSRLHSSSAPPPAIPITSLAVMAEKWEQNIGTSEKVRSRRTVEYV